ncbi:outer membrane beta-barrel protein [Caulobacter segnis]
MTRSARPRTSIENDYHLQEDIYAGYLMGELHITPALSVTAGARIEHTNSDISAQGFVAQVTADPNTRRPFCPDQGGAVQDQRHHRYLA